MDNTTIFARARRLINVNSIQWTDTDMLLDANVIYHDIVETIVNAVWEDLMIRAFNADSVTGQSAYDLQEATALVVWHKKIKRVSVQYSSTDTYPKVLNEVAQNWLPLALEYYEQNTATADAFFFLNGNKIHIFPAPSEDIIDAIEIKSAITPIDLVTGWAEALNLIPRQFHDTLVQGMIQFELQHLWKINEKNDAISNYERLKNDLVTKLSDRITAPLYWLQPDLSHLE